jgi:hypothetical protein
MRAFRLVAATLLLALCSTSQAHTVWRCVRDGTVSLATAPEPGSKCTAKTLDDDSPRAPNLWGAMGQFHGSLYRRVQEGTLVYSTRDLPGSVKIQTFTVAAPPSSFAHAGFGKVGLPQLGVYRREFASAASKTGLEEAWLRAIAHAESNYAAQAVSMKGAKGVMQLMPDTISDYRVTDPFSASQSIIAGAKYLKALESRYDGDRILAAAAYNAGPGSVAQFGGVPPYAETRDYISKVSALYASYRSAMGLAPRSIELMPAQ